MNIKSSAQSGKYANFDSKARALRKELQSEIAQQRKENKALLKDGTIDRREYRQTEDFLNKHDLDRIKKRARILPKIVSGITGFAGGALLGYQGGAIGGITGGVLGASASDGLSIHKEINPLAALGAGVASAAAMAFAGSQGGVIGALAGGVAGSVALNYGTVPFLLEFAFNN